MLQILMFLLSQSTHADLEIAPTDLQVFTGFSHSCALASDQNLKCWGMGSRGQLGQGNTQTRGDNPGEMGKNLKSINLGIDKERILQVAPGTGYTCVLFDSGSVKCFGENASRELGLKHINPVGTSPAHMGLKLEKSGRKDFFGKMHAFENVQKLILSTNKICALLKTGTLYCWGNKLFAKKHFIIGREKLFGPKEKVLNVFSGANHTCALFESGRTKCWGANGVGQLGMNNTRLYNDPTNRTRASSTPFTPLEGLPRVAKMTMGNRHTCALFEDSTVRCWGDNSVGQLGRGDRVRIGAVAGDLPSKLKAIGFGTSEKIKDLVSGGDHTCALFESGKLKCFGDNSRGVLGLGTTVPNLGASPNDVANAPYINVHPDFEVTQVSTSISHTCAVIGVLGAFKCWGSNSSGVLGLGDTLDRGALPTQMGAGLPFVDLRN